MDDGGWRLGENEEAGGEPGLLCSCALHCVSARVREGGGEGGCGDHAVEHALERHGVRAGAPALEEVAAASPAAVVEGHLVGVVLTFEIDLEAAHVHTGPLLGVALRLVDLADES